jgi:hypothetical protein
MVDRKWGMWYSRENATVSVCKKNALICGNASKRALTAPVAPGRLLPEGAVSPGLTESVHTCMTLYIFNPRH